MASRQLLLGAVAIVLAVLVGPRLLIWARQNAAPQKLAPFATTPEAAVEEMLRLARVGPSDVVYDLGCGDGRIVIAAAQKFGARGVGIDFDPQRILEALANAKKAGVESLVEFKQQDARTVDVSPATVVTLYLLSSSNLELRPMLTRQLRAGARIVSYQFPMGDWQPDRIETMPKSGATIYLWTTDGHER